MSANLRNYAKAVYALDAVVQRVQPDQWDNQSPCEQWSAREVLGHVIWHTNRLANACEGNPPPPEMAEAVAAGPDPTATWSAARDRALAALDQQGVLQQPWEGPFGPSNLDGSLALSTFDAMTHAWDIAKATGQQPVVPADLAQMGIDMVSTAGDFVRQPGILGPALAAPAGADVVEQYIALSGRQV